MELRTEAVDRVLEALSPALAAELERVVSETRQQLEADFEKRLKNAIRDAEDSMRLAAEAERLQAVEQAIEETRETVRQQVTKELTEQLQTEFDKRLEEVTRRAAATQEAEFQKAQSGWNSERDRLQQQLDRWQVFREAQRQLKDANSQPEILVRWLNLAQPFADSIAVYTSRADGLALWKSRGSTVFPQIISQQTTDPESYFKPIVIRGKTVAAVCAASGYRAEALDVLTPILEQAIELFGLRLRAR